jgi:hypothetical protein
VLSRAELKPLARLPPWQLRLKLVCMFGAFTAPKVSPVLLSNGHRTRQRSIVAPSQEKARSHRAWLALRPAQCPRLAPDRIR